MLVVIAVSFFDYENAQIIETFILDNYRDVFTSNVTLQQYAKLAEVRRHRLGDHAGHRLQRSLLPGLPRPQRALADRTVSAVHGAVLDLQHHPHDLLAAGPGQERHHQPGSGHARPDPLAAGIPAVFGFRGRRRLCPPVHAVHGGADLQLDGAHRSQPDRGGARRRRRTVPHRVGDRAAALARPALRSARSSW